MDIGCDMGMACWGACDMAPVWGSALRVYLAVIPPLGGPLFLLIAILSVCFGAYRDILSLFGQLHPDQHFEIGLNNARNGVGRKYSIFVQSLLAVCYKCSYTGIS